MEQPFKQPEVPGGRRRLMLIVAALLVVSTVVVLLVFLLPCDGEESLPPGEDGGAPIEVVDAAAPDVVLAVDLAPDQKPRPRGTRRITDRELRAVLRRQRGLINACYTLAARRAPAMTPSRVSVTVTLGDAGRVRSVAVAAGGARRLSGCLRRAIRGLRFSKSLRAQQVSFPILKPR